MEKKHRNFGIWDVKGKADFWKKLAENINGDFKTITTVSRDLNRLELKSVYKKASITFKESDTKPLFVNCEIEGFRDHLWFEISKRDFTENIIGLFSSRKIQSKNPDFNKHYASKTDDKFKLGAIINDPAIAEPVLSHDITFIGGKQADNGNFMLDLNVHRNINTFDQLEAIYNLTIRLIDALMK